MPGEACCIDLSYLSKMDCFLILKGRLFFGFFIDFICVQYDGCIDNILVLYHRSLTPKIGCFLKGRLDSFDFL